MSEPSARRVSSDEVCAAVVVVVPSKVRLVVLSDVPSPCHAWDSWPVVLRAPGERKGVRGA